MSKLQSFLRQEEGASAIEYALLAGLIAMVIVLTVTTVGLSVNGLFAAVGAGLAVAP
ncbi:MAG: Flp family type IVb pilin [Paraburkholderia sp.]|nr:MAG: Flp family type IVb pilin [Paraburkholderia sp.]